MWKFDRWLTLFFEVTDRASTASNWPTVDKGPTGWTGEATEGSTLSLKPASAAKVFYLPSPRQRRKTSPSTARWWPPEKTPCLASAHVESSCYRAAPLTWCWRDFPTLLRWGAPYGLGSKHTHANIYFIVLPGCAGASGVSRHHRWPRLHPEAHVGGRVLSLRDSSAQLLLQAAELLRYKGGVLNFYTWNHSDPEMLARGLHWGPWANYLQTLRYKNVLFFFHTGPRTGSETHVWETPVEEHFVALRLREALCRRTVLPEWGSRTTDLRQC